MCIDTNTAERWDPYRVLIFRGMWLALLVAVVFALTGACTGGNPPPPPSGTISLAWSIFDSTTQPATCDQVGARSVALRLRPRAGGSVIATAMPCAPGSGAAQVAAVVHNLSTAIAIVVESRSVPIAITRLAYSLQRIAFSADIAAGLRV